MIKEYLRWLLWAVFALSAPFVLLFILRTEAGVHLKKAIYASCVPLVLIGLWLIIKHSWKPGRTICLVPTVKLENPPRLLRTLKNHRLNFTCEKHIKEKGEISVIKMDEVIMRFNKKNRLALLR